MNSIALFIFLCGVFFIVHGYIYYGHECKPKTKVEYRYIPRSMYNQQFSDQNLTSVFRPIFKGEDITSSYPRENILNE